MNAQALKGKIALVAGATRGAGRGIAIELGAQGATLYCTGRSIRGNTTGRPDTIDETAELVTQAGGKTGQTVATWDLAEEYGFTDADGTQPHWQRSYEAEIIKDQKDKRE